VNCVVVVEILIQIQLVIVIRKFTRTFFNVFRLSYRTTGHCLRCNRNTYGVYCEKCLPGHWGDALLDIKCHGKWFLLLYIIWMHIHLIWPIACNCHPKGTQRHSDNSLVQCDLQAGQCSCKSNVQGRQCDKCENGYWNLNSDRG
jgi:coxsackievirus/adenovirus receptor